MWECDEQLEGRDVVVEYRWKGRTRGGEGGQRSTSENEEALSKRKKETKEVHAYEKLIR